MSRARPIADMWFDKNRNGEHASDEQLELLATHEQVSMDDLLDTVLTQGEVIGRLRIALGDEPIPMDVLERREEWRKARHAQPMCRKCGKEGDSTKHHFVNKWILKELESYERLWADRSHNTIPMCIECHRKLHGRDHTEDKSIARFLGNDEKDFAERALTALAEERPKLLILIGRGDSYEAQLVKDWLEGAFRLRELPEEEMKPAHLRVVA